MDETSNSSQNDLSADSAIVDTFSKLVEDQFKYGGVKYANSKEREVTDILTDDYGLNGLLWSINKYAYRYKNLGREKDLLKIATYMYIMWLKFGFHLAQQGTVNDNYTTVDTKIKYFSMFMEEVRQYSVPTWDDKLRILDEITTELKALRLRANLTRWRLLNIYQYCKSLWHLGGFDVADTHETDTWNREDEKKRGS